MSNVAYEDPYFLMECASALPNWGSFRTALHFRTLCWFQRTPWQRSLPTKGISECVLGQVYDDFFPRAGETVAYTTG